MIILLDLFTVRHIGFLLLNLANIYGTKCFLTSVDRNLSCRFFLGGDTSSDSGPNYNDVRCNNQSSLRHKPKNAAMLLFASFGWPLF